MGNICNNDNKRNFANKFSKKNIKIINLTRLGEWLARLGKHG